MENTFDSNSWVILSSIEQSIKTKIEKYGTPLKNWNIQINYGIKTGCNEAFIITTAKRDEILANCRTKEERNKTDEIIRPILRGRDIKQYKYDWKNLWLIFIPWHFPLQDDSKIKGASEKAETLFLKNYHSVYNHLLQFKEKLLKRNQAETGIRYEWYALQRWGAEYLQDFEQPKICWPSVGETAFSLIPAGVFLLDTNYFFATKNPEHLLGYLNSSLITWQINSKDTPIGSGGAYRHYKYNMEEISIPSQPDNDLISYVEEQIKCPSKGNQKLINNKIYEKYKLSPEEINFIENKLSS